MSHRAALTQANTPGCTKQAQTYRDEHEGRDLEGASVHRYDIAVEGVKGSVNQLTMVLARLLTPHAVLPKDHVLLEDEVAHERPAIFPWSVQVNP